MVDFKRVVGIDDDGCVVGGLVPEVKVISGLVDGWDLSVDRERSAIWGGRVSMQLRAFGLLELCRGCG